MGRRLAGIEGLRGIAALMVLVTHVGAEMAARATSSGGLLSEVGTLRHGLTLYFALSGFLLFRPFAASLLAGQPLPKFRKYMNNRLLRIFPAYIAVLLVVSYLLQTARLSATGPESKYEASGALPIGDLLVSIPLLQTLNPETTRVGVGVAWSLTTEFTFYLLLPLLALGAMKLARKMPRVVAVWAPVALLLAVGWAGKLVMILATRGMSAEESHLFRWGHDWSAVFARSILVHGDLFAAGMSAAVFVVLFERGALKLENVAIFRGVTAGGFLVAAFLAFKGFPTRYFEDFTAACASALVIVAAVLPTRQGEANAFAKALDFAPLRYAGLVSYGVYLWHMHVLWWLQKHNLSFPDSPAGFVLNTLVVVVITYVLAAGTYRFIEKPALSLKKRTDEPRRKRTAESELAAR